tara:strand:- start:525 stop:716 length:192 start_codon:yes stop_codon:yes gene_type:complete
MYVITKQDTDDPIFDILSENNGAPILFTSEVAAMKYISIICEGFGITMDTYMMDDNIEIWRMH